MAIKNLTGNLGGSSPYGALAYGVMDYGAVRTFQAGFPSAHLTVVPAVSLSGGLGPVVRFAAALSVLLPPTNIEGDLAPQIALAGSLSVIHLPTIVRGDLPLTVAFGPASLISGPLWAPEACPPTQWSPAEPCPPSLWTPVAPGLVAWETTEKCNG